MFPSKLKSGDEIRVIALSKSMGLISSANKTLAVKALTDLGLQVTFGSHVDENDLMHSSSVKSRITDLHEAFADPNVKAILTVLGGYNANQLLSSIDYDLIKQNPKIFCGFSDITALGNALYHKTGLVTYSGLHFSSFAMQKGFEYSLEHFKKIFFHTDELPLLSSKEWSDDAWYLDQDNRTFHSNSGYHVLNPGHASGTIIGGNLGTLQLLRGTPYMPNLEGTILFLEEVSAGPGADVEEFDRNLQSLIYAPDFAQVQAIVIGRFETSFGMTQEKLEHLISTKPALKSFPIIANADFGHTTPIFTFPVGGTCHLQAEASGKVDLVIERNSSF
ncbi:MAG: LD-carboxypeptidase [Alphaproteobacteria bacterium]|nr:LD-carboxypeptidase [Alphaproteobacteria bacterium]